MNKPSIIINIALAGAIALLYVLHFKGKSSCTSAPANTIAAPAFVSDSAGNFPVAYVNLDSLLLNYRYYNKLKSEHEAKYKASEGRLRGQAEALQQEAALYQDRAQKGTMTRAEMQAKETELQGRQQQLMQLEQQLTQELDAKEQQMQKQIYDSLQLVLKQYNANGRYRMIMNNAFGNSLLNADGVDNITDSITVILNNRSGIK